MPDCPTTLILVGHGTRNEPGISEFHAVARWVAERLPGWPVEPAFLELAQPSLSDSLRRATEAGAQQVVVAPLLLFAAGHAKRDLPHAIAAALEGHRELEVRLAPHLGCHPALLELSALRYADSLANRPLVRASDTLLLMVGRGSRDPTANSEMAMFSRLRCEAEGVGWGETCFAALAEPSLERALAIVGRMPFRRVVIQPHLLFQGELLASIRHTVEVGVRRWPGIEWVLTSHLGSHPLLAEAIVARVTG
jgi:sirohydrochlorin cobaltochelatase